jgi:hypothetical protein
MTMCVEVAQCTRAWKFIQSLAAKLEAKKALGKSRRRVENNIKMELKSKM